MSPLTPPTVHGRRLALALVLAAAASSMVLRAFDTPAPISVTIAGSLQSELGCPGDWQPDCASTFLVRDPIDDVWQGTFQVPAGSWEYKAALNGSWSENYGRNAAANGSNIPLDLPAGRAVKFYYDHKSHWITDNVGSVIATAPGSFQSELGCPGDWDPSCLRSWLQDPDGDGVYTFVTRDLPPGSYEAKAAIDESWDLNYGAGGVQNGPNIPFAVSAPGELVTFSYNAISHALTISNSTTPPQPSSVTIAGSFQSELWCPGDWQADCAATHLAFDADDEVWQAQFSVPAGNWEYKAALTDSWDENYGLHALRNGPNIPVSLAGPRTVKFYYDHASHWVTDNATSIIATAPGSFQTELGCPGDWDPSCLRSWLQDADGDGLYTFSTRRLPPGNYETKVAIDESWTLNYGAGGEQNGPNIAFSVPTVGTEIFFVWNSLTHVLSVSAEGAPKGDLTRARAHWVSGDLLLWDVADVQPDCQINLHVSSDATLALTSGGVTGGTAIPLTYDPAGAPAGIRDKFPHLAAYAAFRLPPERLAEVPDLLRGQLAISAKTAAGAPVDATSLQIPGVLDDLFGYDGPLGPAFTGTSATLRLWAPTAQQVSLRLYDSSDPAAAATAEIAMTFDRTTGVWSAPAGGARSGTFYAYVVRVFTRATNHIETNIVTDPYSVSLSMNSGRSQLVSLDDPALMPSGWPSLTKPPLAAPEDITLYELHIRDFSANDRSVRDPWRGTYMAFAERDAAGMRHLRSLARAGLTHVHLLPSFDLASIDEDKTTWQAPAGDLASFPPDSEEQQARVSAVANRDGFNWGYDPWHYNVPDGSYATEPDGAARIREFRTMVQALSDSGLRVVTDVVYNHTTAAGQDAKSVLDRIVPGYYHRLNRDGFVETSTCCQNTATEHAMMEKLMIDSVVLWAKHYKVDGFRFDLMGHHMKRNMLNLRAALDALTPATDGVDGRRIYLYGEGWNFGEVADNARGVNAVQLNMTGTGIGSFNDRIRDAARGGGPFSGRQEQGFLTGLFTAPNGTNQGSPDEQLARLLTYEDRIKISLAGNLRDFVITDRLGHAVRGDQLDYNGLPAGYAADPQDVINYVEAHDNETLWDAIQLKASMATSVAERARMQMLGISLVGLGQGVPFFHAGVEMLRSKSLDRNSYNSGDWFNKLDFTYETNNWGAGLPPASENQPNWPLFRPLLGNPALAVARPTILPVVDHFREILAIRKSSPLFRLGSGQQIQAGLRFLNEGPDRTPGVIALELQDAAGAIDRRWDRIAVVFNASPMTASIRDPALIGSRLDLHPIQQESSDSIVRMAGFQPASGTFSVPGRTAAVFVSSRPAVQRVQLLLGDIAKLQSAGILPAGLSNALSSKLSAAMASIARRNRSAAEGQLGAFAHQCRALAASGLLPAADAEGLTREANEIVALLERAGI